MLKMVAFCPIVGFDMLLRKQNGCQPTDGAVDDLHESCLVIGLFVYLR